MTEGIPAGEWNRQCRRRAATRGEPSGLGCCWQGQRDLGRQPRWVERTYPHRENPNEPGKANGTARTVAPRLPQKFNHAAKSFTHDAEWLCRHGTAFSFRVERPRCRRYSPGRRHLSRGSREPFVVRYGSAVLPGFCQHSPRPF